MTLCSNYLVYDSLQQLCSLCNYCAYDTLQQLLCLQTSAAAALPTQLLRLRTSAQWPVSVSVSTQIARQYVSVFGTLAGMSLQCVQIALASAKSCVRLCDQASQGVSVCTVASQGVSVCTVASQSVCQCLHSSQSVSVSVSAQ